jgi:hypothetical protein
MALGHGPAVCSAKKKAAGSSFAALVDFLAWRSTVEAISAAP